MLKIRKTVCLIAIALSIVSMVAYGKSKKKEIDPATAMVSISGSRGKAIGFITQYGKRRVIVTSALAVFDSDNVTVTDSNKRKLKLSKVFYFAKDRDLAMLCIKRKNTKNNPLLPLEKNISGLKTNGKVKAFGKLGEQQIKTLDKTSIVLSNSIKKVAFGTPVISEETGNVIGVVVRMADDSDIAKDKISLTPTGKCIARLDNISKKIFVKRSKSRYARGLRKYHKLREVNEWGDVVMQAISDKYLGGIDINKKLPKTLVWKDSDEKEELDIPVKYKIMNDIFDQWTNREDPQKYLNPDPENYPNLKRKLDPGNRLLVKKNFRKNKDKRKHIDSEFFLLLGLVRRYIAYAAISTRKHNLDYYVIEQASRVLLAHNDLLCKKIKNIKSLIDTTTKTKYEEKKYRLLGKPKPMTISNNRR
jgi:hypothetical protein